MDGGKSVVLRIRTPSGMVRNMFHINASLEEVVKKAQDELQKKDKIVANAELFQIPVSSDSSPLPLHKTLSALHVTNGSMFELKGTFKSTKIEIPDSEKSIFDLPAIPYDIPECALHGKDQSCVRCMTARYVRVDRKEKSDCVGVAADKKAIAVFNYNLKANLAYSIQRIGILYGIKREDGIIQVDVIYEPMQEATATEILLMPNEMQYERADAVARGLGYKRVGCIIGQTVEDCDDEEFILTADQLLIIGSLKQESEDFIILTAGAREGNAFVEAFELTDQFYDLYKRRYFLRPNDEFFLQVKLPLWIQNKEESEAEVEFFIVPLPLQEWKNDMRSEFPVENRLVAQNEQFVHRLLSQNGKLEELLLDFHLLLFLGSQFCNSDLEHFVRGVKAKKLEEGHVLIVKSLAGLL